MIYSFTGDEANKADSEFATLGYVCFLIELRFVFSVYRVMKMSFLNCSFNFGL